MAGFSVVQEKDPRKLLAALKAEAGRVLLLDEAQSLKVQAGPMPGATDEGLWWLGAAPHPDLVLGSHGAWLLAANRPPFACARLRDISAWGLLGPAQVLAQSLAAALETSSKDGDWQPAFFVELRRRVLRPQFLKDTFVVQNAIPSLEACLDQERRRGAALARLGAAAEMEAPPALTGEEIPADWSHAAEAVAQVPLRPLKNVKLAGQAAPALLGNLAQALMAHCFHMAFVEGWHAPAAPAAIARPLRRVAVLYPAYGGSLNLAQRSAEAAERLGFEVVRVDPSARRDEVRSALRNGGMTAELYRSIEKEGLDLIAQSKPQMLWILAQAFLAPDTARALRRRGMLTAFWFCEDYRLNPWRETALSVDAFFPLQGGPFSAALRAAGVPVMSPLPACAASEACRLPMPEGSSKPLTFFGYPYKNRRSVFESLGEFPLEIYGERWNEFATPALKAHIKDGSLLNEAQGFELFRQSAVNLNLHSSPFVDGVDPDGDYVNPRTFEIAACGAFQLCDRRRDLAAAFVEGSEIEAFSSVAELREKITRWSSDAKGRRAIAEAARRRVLADHTYEQRLKTALGAMGVPLVAGMP